MINKIYLPKKNYAKFRILNSLFSKLRKKEFHVLVFETLTEKITYETWNFMLKNENYGKKNRHLINQNKLMTKSEPIIKSTSNDKKKPITLTYFLKDQ